MFLVLSVKIIKGSSLPIINGTIISETIIYEDCLYIYPHYDITFCWVKLTVWLMYAFGSWLVDAVHTTASFVDWSVDAISSCFIEHTSVTNSSQFLARVKSALAKSLDSKYEVSSSLGIDFRTSQKYFQKLESYPLFIT